MNRSATRAALVRGQTPFDPNVAGVSLTYSSSKSRTEPMLTAPAAASRTVTTEPIYFGNTREKLYMCKLFAATEPMSSKKRTIFGIACLWGNDEKHLYLHVRTIAHLSCTHEPARGKLAHWVLCLRWCGSYKRSYRVVDVVHNSC